MASVARNLKDAVRAGKDRIPIGAGIWLLWVGVGVNATLSSMGYHWIIAQGLSMIFFIFWGVYNVDLGVVLRRVLFGLVEVFFKNFDVAGKSNVPEDGPVIFACAPHNSQFVDGLCVLKAVPRPDLGFLVAAVSLRRGFVGKIVRALNNIGVERPQDLAVAGSGEIIVEAESDVVKGVGTKFTSEAYKKCQVKIIEGKFKHKGGKIKEVISDTEAKLYSPIGVEGKAIVKYKVIPHLDHSQVFEQVYKRLRRGGAVGIFPEGGSHDRTQLLPLKAGITFMALGAMASSPGMKVKIIPLGLNYFKGHHFRSRVFIDIGAPIIPSDEQVQMYSEGGDQKRQACNELLQTIMAGIKACTIEAQDYDTLQFFRAMRRLYWHQSRRMTPEERFALTNAFAKGYPKVKDKPEVKKLYSKVQEYRTMLKDYAISDYRVSMVETAGDDQVNVLGGNFLIGLIIYRSIILLVYFCAAIPGSVAAAPYFLVSNYISSQKAKEAAAKSSVKIAGRDLIATWKLIISMGLVPALHFFYTFLFWAFFGETAAIVYFFFMPFISLLTVLSSEMSMKLWSSLKPLTIALASKETGLTLVAKRREVAAEVLKVVKEYEWDKPLMDNKEMKHLFRRMSSLYAAEGKEDLLSPEETCLG
ncbi:hypothetical protein AAMO2058_000509600 [Amorphochlora amoebiformis]